MRECILSVPCDDGGGRRAGCVSVGMWEAIAAIAEWQYGKKKRLEKERKEKTDP